jgi:membrane protein DedA with SNARE-associated domain
MAIALLALAGLLVGGTISLAKQNASRFSIALVGALALLAVAAGIVWLIPGEGP